MNYISWVEKLISSNDFITTDRYLYSSKENGYLYKKRDYLFHFGRRWRGQVQIPVSFDQLLSHKSTLVVGHSDIATGKRELHFLKLLGFKRVFGVNMLNLGNFSSAVPLGLTNDCDDSPIHRIIGDTSHFAKAHEDSNPPQNFKGSIYVNFTTENNFAERKSLLDLTKNLKGVVYETPHLTIKGRIEYLKSLRNFDLVLAPEGNGFDTHRLWETLYMGGTPVVKRNNYLPKELLRLPVIFIDSWAELYNSKKVEQLWIDAQSKRVDLSSLEAKYWIKRFNSQI
jgi:hypothetical protein